MPTLTSVIQRFVQIQQHVADHRPRRQLGHVTRFVDGRVHWLPSRSLPRHPARNAAAPIQTVPPIVRASSCCRLRDKHAAERKRDARPYPAVIRCSTIRRASAWAASTYTGSFNSANAAIGVFVAMRRIVHVSRLVASSAIADGYGLVRRQNVYNPRR